MAISIPLACYYNKKRQWASVHSQTRKSSSPETPTSVTVSVESPEYGLQPVDDHTESSAQDALPDCESSVYTLQKENEECS